MYWPTLLTYWQTLLTVLAHCIYCYGPLLLTVPLQFGHYLIIVLIWSISNLSTAISNTTQQCLSHGQLAPKVSPRPFFAQKMLFFEQSRSEVSAAG